MSNNAVIYEVIYEARKHGSIGKFSHVSRIISASSVRLAKDEVFNMLQEEGYETRFPIQINLIEGASTR